MTLDQWLKEMKFKNVEDLKKYIHLSKGSLKSVMDISNLFLNIKISEEEKEILINEIMERW